ncbi:MAG: sulfite exporter TauE/SafE family protein [Luteolibacter sp.]
METIHTTLGALVAGLVTSVHCLGMCGPMVCGMAAMPATERERTLGAVAYHVARLSAYAMIGAACGALGRQPLQWFFDSPLAVLPWVLVAVFLIFGFGLEKKLPRPVALLKWTSKLRFRAAKLHPIQRGAVMGMMTPLLPCGPLYLLFGASLLAGSGWRGAEFALAFGLGTVPLLWVAQAQLHLLKRRVSPRTMLRVQRSLALVAAVVVAWRLHGTLPGLEAASQELPSCCH